MKYSREIFISISILICNVCEAIMYGKMAEPGQFKYQVLLKMNNGEVTRHCGAGIIDEHYILTAWHCVRDMRSEHIEAIVGAVKFSNDPNAMSYRIEAVKLHSNRFYVPNGIRYYDIALLKTIKPIKYTSYVDDALLPESDITSGTECVFAGWGINEQNPDKESDELRYGLGKISPSWFCKHWLPNIQDYEFCFHRVKNSQATINHGDSGTPLVCNDIFTGVIIRGKNPLHPMLAINVYKLLDFIYDEQSSSDEDSDCSDDED